MITFYGQEFSELKTPYNIVVAADVLEFVQGLTEWISYIMMLKYGGTSIGNESVTEPSRARAETGEETYYIVGESRTNVDNAITKVYGSFFIAFEVIPSTGEIIQTDCSRTLELTNDFIRKLFLHKHLETDAKVIEEAIQRRYHGSSWKALIVAYRDALKHYQRAMAAEAEEKGKKGDN